MSEINEDEFMSISVSLNDISENIDTMTAQLFDIATNTDTIAAVLSGIAEAINKLTEAVENKGK